LRFYVMAGHSRPKDGVASLAYVPAIHVSEFSGSKTWMPGTRPGMTPHLSKFRPPVTRHTPF